MIVLFVASVKTLLLVVDNATATFAHPSSFTESTHSLDDVITFSESPLLSVRRVEFVETVPRRVQCVSAGGYPHPDLHVYLKERDITHMFTLVSFAVLYGKEGKMTHFLLSIHCSHDSHCPFKLVMLVQGQEECQEILWSRTVIVENVINPSRMLQLRHFLMETNISKYTYFNCV